jgi:hypothetical protein
MAGLCFITGRYPLGSKNNRVKCPNNQPGEQVCETPDAGHPPESHTTGVGVNLQPDSDI